MEQETLSGIPVVRTVAALRRTIAGWRQFGERVVLVPTMGALHRGHLALVERGHAESGRVCTSIFVNPTQFAPTEDFGTYPRNEAGDAAQLATVGCDLIYAPTAAEMYAPGFSTAVTVSGVSEGLCGAVRPHFFRGVATVVSKLLIQALPDVAVFGEKDYQQLLVVRRMARDLDLPTAIVGVPIVREPDGLALSSRNAYLSETERRAAPVLYQVLCWAAAAVQGGGGFSAIAAEGKRRLQAGGFQSVDYFELRDAESLGDLERANVPGRLLAAARLGRTRLIDNVPVAAACD